MLRHRIFVVARHVLTILELSILPESVVLSRGLHIPGALCIYVEVFSKLSSVPWLLTTPTCMSWLRIGWLELMVYLASLDAAIARPTCTCTCTGFGCAGKYEAARVIGSGAIFLRQQQTESMRSLLHRTGELPFLQRRTRSCSHAMGIKALAFITSGF